jgi:hypothetical protein
MNKYIILILLCIMIIIIIKKDDNNTKYKKLSKMDMYHYKKREKAYICTAFYFDNLEYENIINRIKIVIKNRVKDNLYLLIYKKKLYNNKVKKLKMSDEDILKNLILHNYIAKNHKDMINKTYRSKLFWGISIDIKNNLILMCWNHAICDGYRSMLPVQKILLGYNHKIKNTKLIKTNFLLNSVSISKLFLNINFILKLNNKDLYLEKNMKNVTFNFRLNFDDINNKVKPGSNFNSTLQKIIINKIIPDSYKNKEFLYGVIFATEQYKSFNGLGIIPYFLKKKQKNKSIIINKKIKNNFYIGINSINKLFSEIIDINPNFDIIFSGLKFTNDNNCFNNSKAINFYTYMPYHKAPIYIFTAKFNNDIFVSVGVKNKNIYNHIKSNYNWSYIKE